MNNLQRDQFIFNYLEGNLSKSEQDLFEEIKSSDSEFKESFESWEKSYALKDKPKDVFINKASLSPKRILYKYYFFASVIIIAVLGYSLLKENSFEKEERQTANTSIVNKENRRAKISQLEIVNKVSNDDEQKKYNSISSARNEKETIKPKVEPVTNEKEVLQDLPTKLDSAETMQEELPSSLHTEVKDTLKPKISSKAVEEKTQGLVVKEEKKPEKERKPRKSFKQRMRWMKESFKNQVVIPVE